MTIRAFALLAAIFPILSLSAQDGTVKGKVSDGKTKETLGGVSIYVDGKGVSSSGPDGDYEIKVPAGSHTFEFKFIGYAKYISKKEVKEGETLALDIPMGVEATELGVMVVSAGKFEQRREDVTVSMEVVKSDLVQNNNITRGDDIVQKVPGVNVLDGQANIRGGSGYTYGAGTRVLVLVDDMPLVTGDAGDVKWEFIPMENIEQIEVVKGAASALYGSSALNGVINFRTSYPKDTARTSVVLASGIIDHPRRDTLDWYGNTNPMFSNASFSHSRQIKNLDLVIGGNVSNDAGYRQLEKAQRFRFNLGTRYRFQKVKGLSAGLNANYLESTGGSFLLWQSADSAFTPRGYSVSEYITVRATVDPFVTYFTPKGNRMSLTTRFFQTININNTAQGSTANVYYGQFQYQLHLKKDLNNTNGIAATKSDVMSQLYGDHNSLNYAVFSQWDKKFDRLSLSFGARAEYFKVDTAETKTDIKIGSKTSTLPFYPVFRSGANYRIFKYTNVRASFGQGYRFPSIAEKFISTRVDQLNVFPNPSVRSETGWSAEIGAIQGFKIGNFKGYVDIAAFRQRYLNMIEFAFNYYGPRPITGLSDIENYFGAKSLNVGRTQITGVEFSTSGEGNIGNVKLTMLGGYTYINPIRLDGYDTTGTYRGEKNILKYRYEHLAKIDAQATYRKWSIGFSAVYNSFMKNIDKAFQVPVLSLLDSTQQAGPIILPGLKEYRAKHNKGNIVLGMRISHEIGKGAKIALLINNLLNLEYMGRPGDIQRPRTFSLVASMRI